MGGVLWKPVSLYWKPVLPVFFQPLPLGRAREPFSHPDWIFEIKWDGFRAIARIENGRCKLISRNGNEFKSFPSLNTSIPPELRAPSALLDGEIVCLDADGRPNFRDLLFHRGEPRFIAFDLPWCNGENLRYAPLIERKFRLRLIMPRRGERLIYCDHIEGNGEALFRLACERDLEGIVAKRKFDPYLPALAMWQKIRNQNYSQWAGREELFDRERESSPEFQHWGDCTLACQR